MAVVVGYHFRPFFKFSLKYPGFTFFKKLTLKKTNLLNLLKSNNICLMNNTNRSWALLFARSVLGLIFFMAGMYKVFQMGPLVHARKLFVQPYSDTFLPISLLWTLGTIVPVIELIAGAFIIIGFQIRNSLVLLGFVLVIVTFGHLLKEPLYEFHTHVIPRLALLLFVLILPREDDRFSLDYFLLRRKKEL